MLKTRLTEKFGLDHPIISAPMAFAATGKLASAVSKAGAMGLIGGGYGDIDWIKEQFKEVHADKVGCGLITWSIVNKPEVLEKTLDLNPEALFLSFGNPEIHARKIKQRNITLICQVQTLKDAQHALDCGADIIVAQGTEAGGHGEIRSTFTLVPETADLIAKKYPEALLCAAGGIADGRGLAASLVLGADGVLMGSRLWASQEANVSKAMQAAALNATGDNTIRTSVMDVMRKLDWPSRYNARVLKNRVTDNWHKHIKSTEADLEKEAAKWVDAWKQGDPEKSNTFVGEATGLIHEITDIKTIIENTITQAKRILNKRY